MITKKILLPSVVATSVMTLFSYLITEGEKKNFRESELLAKIEKKKLAGLSKQYALPAGWATHYIVGVLMTELFYITWQQLNIKSTLNRAVVSSLLGGMIAICSWRLLFTMLPKRSDNYYKKFYTQLFIAHIIFAVVVTAMKKTTK